MTRVGVLVFSRGLVRVWIFLCTSPTKDSTVLFDAIVRGTLQRQGRIDDIDDEKRRKRQKTKEGSRLVLCGRYVRGACAAMQLSCMSACIHNSAPAGPSLVAPFSEKYCTPYSVRLSVLSLELMMGLVYGRVIMFVGLTGLAAPYKYFATRATIIPRRMSP